MNYVRWYMRRMAVLENDFVQLGETPYNVSPETVMRRIYTLRNRIEGEMLTALKSRGTRLCL